MTNDYHASQQIRFFEKPWKEQTKPVTLRDQQEDDARLLLLEARLAAIEQKIKNFERGKLYCAAEDCTKLQADWETAASLFQEYSR